ncbi:MAG: hypothetical protein HGA95_00885 [Caldiserica bacterium]|nr:hypothetical protein [Caldisericota bacterium]
METKDITRHFVWALVISVGWWLITWLLGLIPSIGGWLIQIISWMFVFGLLFYAINGKGVTHGLMAGAIYAIVFIVVYILLSGMLFTLPISGSQLGFFGPFANFSEMFKWPGIWLQIVAFLVFAGFIGWANEQK